MSVTPPLRVNGLQIVAHDAPENAHGYGPFSGIQIAIQKEAPPHSGNGGVLWSDGETLHWSTASGRDVALPRVTSSQLLVVDDVRAISQSQATAALVGGVCGGLAMLLALVVAQVVLRWRATVRWERSQPKPAGGPYRQPGAKEEP